MQHEVVPPGEILWRVLSMVSEPTGPTYLSQTHKHESFETFDASVTIASVQEHSRDLL